MIVYGRLSRYCLLLVIIFELTCINLILTAPILCFGKQALKKTNMINKEFLIDQWTKEIKATATSFRTVPDAKANYKPSEKTRSASELVSHMLGEINDMNSIIDNGSIDHVPAVITTMEEAAKTYEAKATEFLDKLTKVDENTWTTKIIPMIYQGNKVYEAPMAAMVWVNFKDMIHHRGQLSTYFRPMGAKNPSIYGPTAEMMEEMAAQKN